MKRTGRGINTAPGRPPTPECESCGTKMVPASATEWKCNNSACSEKGVPKNMGVFPT